MTKEQILQELGQLPEPILVKLLELAHKLQAEAAEEEKTLVHRSAKMAADQCVRHSFGICFYLRSSADSTLCFLC